MLMGAQQVTSASRRADVGARAWDYAVKHEVFGYAEIAAELTISMEAATGLVRGWEAEGRVRVICGGNGNSRKKFEVSPEYRAPKGRTGQVSQQLWTAMRGLKIFSPIDLAAHCRDDLKIDLVEARSYCQALLRAGYLKVKSTAVPGKREATYQLVRNSGPRAPIERRVVTVWDPNETAYAYLPGVGRLDGSK